MDAIRQKPAAPTLDPPRDHRERIAPDGDFRARNGIDGGADPDTIALRLHFGCGYRHLSTPWRTARLRHQ